MTIDQVLQANLTPAQRDAARDPAANVLCLACAGSGKSRTLAYRIARLLAEGAHPESIVAFTFTEKAAESIKLRVASALTSAGLSPLLLGAMYIGTIHAYCQQILGDIDARYRQFDVLDGNRLKLFLISRYPQLQLQALRQAHTTQAGAPAGYFNTIEEVASAWCTFNDEMLTAADVRAHDPLMADTIERLRDLLEQEQFIDFSLMIRLVVDRLTQADASVLRVVNDLRHVMVDEYQDVNPQQETLIARLRPFLESLFVVGDDDQAIYAWRGADVRNIQEFPSRYAPCSVHTLSDNFRSTEPIVTISDQFAAAELSATRMVKNPTAHSNMSPRDTRVLWFGDRASEAQWVADKILAMRGTAYADDPANPQAVRGLTPADFAILMRSTATTEQTGNPRHHAFTSALDQRGIPYSLEAGGSVFDRPQVAALRSSFDLLRNGAPDRNTAQQFFQQDVLPAYPRAVFADFADVIAAWAVRIHPPAGGPRIRLYPQQLVHDLLNSFGIALSNFDAGVMQALGTFSRILQDVESVYMSVDSTRRFQEVLNFLQNVAESGYDSATGEILRRPDTVTVSTVHKMKGLEFPVVFLVDVQAQRFPTRNRQYSGWLPQAPLQNALARGAYQSSRPEEARLFYTALTRAERFLFVSGSQNLPGGKRPTKRSQFAIRLAHGEIEANPMAPTPGLVDAPQARRVDETVMPTSYSDIKYYLRCPRDYQLRKCYGFSPPIADLFGFGSTVHAAVCKAHEVAGSAGALTEVQAREIAAQVFHLKHVPQSRDPDNSPGPYERARDAACNVVGHYARDYSEDFERRRQVEVRFEIPVRQAVISGAIDLMLKQDAAGNVLEATVVDFKAMEGGPEPANNENLHWTELALQVQLYAKAARDVLGEDARTGAVHLLKDGKRVQVPVDDAAVHAALMNVEWAVDRIIAGDFPMRPSSSKCGACDFRMLCHQQQQVFQSNTQPPPIHTLEPSDREMARCFSDLGED